MQKAGDAAIEVLQLSNDTQMNDFLHSLHCKVTRTAFPVPSLRMSWPCVFKPLRSKDGDAALAVLKMVAQLSQLCSCRVMLVENVLHALRCQVMWLAELFQFRHQDVFVLHCQVATCKCNLSYEDGDTALTITQFSSHAGGACFTSHPL